MKTIIIFFVFLLLPFASLAQVDTTNFEFKASGSDGKYTMLTNKVTFLGKAAGEIVTPIVINAQSIDTSKWLFVPIGSDGTYRLIENKESFYGKDSGTVRAELVSELSSVGTATTSSGTATLNSIYGIVTTDNLATNSVQTIVINNSYVTETSLILYSIRYLDASDVDESKILLHGIVLLQTGQFHIKIVRAQAFTGEASIHFQIIN